MPIYHARSKALRAIKTELSLKHTEAVRVLDDPRCERLCYYINMWSLTTYAEAVAMVEDPVNQILCDKCGWTKGMACPDCASGCGCNVECSGWRHNKFDGELDDDEGGCPECGADDGTTYGCDCFNPTPSHCRECGASWNYDCAC